LYGWRSFTLIYSVKPPLNLLRRKVCREFHKHILAKNFGLMPVCTGMYLHLSQEQRVLVPAHTACGYHMVHDMADSCCVNFGVIPWGNVTIGAPSLDFFCSIYLM
jgi:hypothetical protein